VAHLTFSESRPAPSVAARLRAGEFIVAPGVYDLISARVADKAGFAAIYMTGYGAVASYLGLPDVGLATFTDMRDRAARIASVCSTPLIADADTGYGGLLNVAHTVAGYESAGVQAIQLEDQEFPKKCGHTPGRRVVPAEDMADKVRVAAETRNSKEFLIIARTDARSSLGLDEALRRAEMYLRAGADVLFIESPESIEEMQRIGKAFSGVPLMANMVEGGRTPLLPSEQLRELGYRITIFPAAGFLAAAAALRGIYEHLRASGSTQGAAVPVYDFPEFSRLMGFETVWAFERTWAR
jgi:2-methylisocitrate lyase-like PEP mutase family enzyme